MSFIKYIADESHYKEVLSLVAKAKSTVWIGTADIKDLYVDDKPFLALIASDAASIAPCMVLCLLAGSGADGSLAAFHDSR